MKTPEGVVKDAVRELLDQYQGLYQFWPVQTGYGRATIDVLGCFRGRFFGIETKAPGKEPTPRQLEVMADIRAAGGAVFAVIGKEDLVELKAWLDSIDRITPHDHDLTPAPTHR